ncbi:hypothetical protein FO519_003521 [Halicephalobus sp. NKZ332]|nr:hypothetical protein FO519_003521 [Halicephalobus sp. NKZ332]
MADDSFLTNSRKVFQTFVSKDETISVAQVGDVLRVLGLSPTEAEIQKCCEQWTDPNRRLTFEEFAPIYETLNKNASTPSIQEFIEGMANFDREGNGTIHVSELRHLLTNCGEPLNERQFEQLFNGQPDSGGNVYVSDFIRIIMEE